MTPQEAQMLQDLVRKTQQTQLTEKDPDAEALLIDGLSRDPDSMYKLAQTVLIQNLALNQARAQIEQLRQQAAPAAAPAAPARGTTFLGSLLGHRPAPPPPQYENPQAPPQYRTAPPAYAEPASYPAAAPSGAGSFLRSAATTAAGVAAGALAFQGIESLMHGGGGFGGGGVGGFGSGSPVEETVVNNYYDDPNAQFGQNQEHEASYDDRVDGPDMQPQGPTDASDTGDDAQLEDASYDPDSDGGSDYDDGGFDNGGGDDLV